MSCRNSLRNSFEREKIFKCCSKTFVSDWAKVLLRKLFWSSWLEWSALQVRQSDKNTIIILFFFSFQPHIEIKIITKICKSLRWNIPTCHFAASLLSKIWHNIKERNLCAVRTTAWVSTAFSIFFHDIKGARASQMSIILWRYLNVLCAQTFFIISISRSLHARSLLLAF
jgi:hypothetical protein